MTPHLDLSNGVSWSITIVQPPACCSDIVRILPAAAFVLRATCAAGVAGWGCRSLGKQGRISVCSGHAAKNPGRADDRWSGWRLTGRRLKIRAPPTTNWANAIHETKELRKGDLYETTAKPQTLWNNKKLRKRFKTELRKCYLRNNNECCQKYYLVTKWA